MGSDPTALRKLSDDPRLAASGFAAAGGGCAMVLVPSLFLGVAFLTRGDKPVSDGFIGAAIVALAVVLALTIGAYFGFRFMFFRDAARVTGSPPPSEIPRVIETQGVVTGPAEWSVKLATRCSAGRFGRCWIELYGGGIQIWKGPERAAPRWQFTYGDLVLAESIDVVALTRGGDTHQHYVRLVVDEPRIAFLFGSRWWRNNDAPVLAAKLRQHGVATTDEELVC